MAQVERQEVLDNLVRRVEESGGVLVRSVKDLAADIGIGPQRLYYLLKSFDQKGQLVTHSRGPKGLEIRLSTGEPPAPKRSRAGVRRPRRAVPSEGEASTGKGFCPWCGQDVQTGWRFCVRCGEELPQLDLPASTGTV